MNRVPLQDRFPRLTAFAVITLVLLAALAITAWQQVPVVIYKLTLVSLAAIAGYWIDRGLFPYARPDSYLAYDWRKNKKLLSEYGSDGNVDNLVVPDHHLVFAAAMLRRAVIVAAVIAGVALGL